MGMVNENGHWPMGMVSERAADEQCMVTNPFVMPARSLGHLMLGPKPLMAPVLFKSQSVPHAAAVGTSLWDIGAYCGI